MPATTRRRRTATARPPPPRAARGSRHGWRSRRSSGRWWPRRRGREPLGAGEFGRVVAGLVEVQRGQRWEGVPVGGTVATDDRIRTQGEYAELEVRGGAMSLGRATEALLDGDLVGIDRGAVLFESSRDFTVALAGLEGRGRGTWRVDAAGVSRFAVYDGGLGVSVAAGGAATPVGAYEQLPVLGGGGDGPAAPLPRRRPVGPAAARRRADGRPPPRRRDHRAHEPVRHRPAGPGLLRRLLPRRRAHRRPATARATGGRRPLRPARRDASWPCSSATSWWHAPGSRPPRSPTRSPSCGRPAPRGGSSWCATTSGRPTSTPPLDRALRERG